MKPTLIIGFMLLTQLTACDFIKQVLSQDDSQAGTASDAEAAAMGYYANGFNAMIDKPHNCMNEYFGKIPEAGPQEDGNYSLFPRHSLARTALSTAEEAFEKGKEASPDTMTHLDALAREALDNLKELVSTFETVHTYYDAENHKDDGAKKGMALHQKMMTLSQSYKTSLNAFETALSQIETQQMQAELKQYEKEKGYGYWFRLYNFEANQLLKVTDNEKFKPAFEKNEKTYTELKAFCDAKGDAINSVFKTYCEQTSRFYAEGKKIARALEQDPPDEEHLSNMQNSLIDAYNSMITLTNSLQSLEASDMLK